MYATASEVCAFIGWDATDAATLARVTAMIPVVEGIINKYLGTTLDYEEDEAKPHLVGETGIVYLTKHLGTLTSVKQVYSDATLSDALDASAVKALPYNRPPYRMVQLYGKNVTGLAVADTRILGVGEVTVEGNWGYEDIPEDVKYAVALTIKYHSDYFAVNEFVSNDSTGLSVVAFKNNDKVVNLQLPNMCRAMLAGYRLSRITND